MRSAFALTNKSIRLVNRDEAAAATGGSESTGGSTGGNTGGDVNPNA